MAKVTKAQKDKWLLDISRLQCEMIMSVSSYGSPLEEAAYNLGQAYERLREVEVKEPKVGYSLRGCKTAEEFVTRLENNKRRVSRK